MAAIPFFEAAMLPRWSILASIYALMLPMTVFAGRQKACVSPDDATKNLNKDVCVQAHVYNVVELPDGTRFLDVCTPETPDDKCRFTIVSLRQDRDTVGDLEKMRDTNIEVRGIVASMHGRSGMVLSHVRQFYGGPPRFRPNPALAHGFTGEQEKPAIKDPNLRPQGGGRAWMSTKDVAKK
ncbi:hypothetical protein [Terracidiphilus gabretensis]|uniref:hypothetical protein n=1 Tax=Terracidiphilus gabretensis TaxID=1577687 RepID=UPI00071BF06C|nr:hypothetical protein [Terracidiphilus gabretensis]